MFLVYSQRVAIIKPKKIYFPTNNNLLKQLLPKIKLKISKPVKRIAKINPKRLDFIGQSISSDDNEGLLYLRWA